MLGDGACYSLWLSVTVKLYLMLFQISPFTERQFVTSNTCFFVAVLFSHLYSLLMQTIISVSLSEHLIGIVFINYINYPIKCCEQFWSSVRIFVFWISRLAHLESAPGGYNYIEERDTKNFNMSKHYSCNI